jgi:hypothetical protein
LTRDNNSGMIHYIKLISVVKKNMLEQAK